MKISASVPDDLWDAAREAANAGSPSAVVQTALIQLVDRHEQGRAYAEPPELVGELGAIRDAARARLVADGRALFQQGYEQGVRLAADFTWMQLDYMVDRGARGAAVECSRFVGEQELTPGKHPEGARPVVDPQVLVPYFGSFADWTGSVPWEPHQVTIEGTDRALRDLWSDIRSAPTSPAGPPTAPDD